ncbi:hypothetical protein [Flagellimonas onchidii]|uniref:hypothetical protein n=1 Tax=Flagellimonas onchidii TaxID=2562684 RepID=UPI00197A8B7B|nr:hypothetical protein [Allomuricauda onchidii]
MRNYLVIGLGLAGISFCEKSEILRKRKELKTNFFLSFVNSKQASVNFGGLFSPETYSFTYPH